MANPQAELMAHPLPPPTQISEADPLADWLVAQLSETSEGHRVSEVRLAHLDVNDRPVIMLKLAVRSHDAAAARSFCNRFRVEANYDAEQRAKLESYAVIVMWPASAEGEIEAHKRFSVDGTHRRDLSLGSTEPATMEGIAKQQMRHNEIFLKILTSHTLQAQNWSESIITRLQKQIDDHETKRFKTLELAESLMSAAAERESAQRREQAAEARRNAAAKEFFDLLPILKAKLVQGMTGHKILGGATAEGIALRTLLKGMGPEAFQELIAKMPEPDQAITLQLYAAAQGIDLSVALRAAAAGGNTPPGGAPPAPAAGNGTNGINGNGAGGDGAH